MSLRLHNSYSEIPPDLAICQVAETLVNQRDLQRFWAKVRRGAPNACWPWTANLVGRHGYQYGQFTLNGGGKQRHVYAHRFAYEVTHGPLVDGQKCCHRCDFTRCCNPAHLFSGTQGDNLRDASSKGHFRCPRPTAHKITTDQLPEIDALLAAGVKKVRIAERFGVTRTWVTQYSKGRLRQYDRPSAHVAQRSA